MLRVTATSDGPVFTLNATAAGVVIYLDNWAICDLAEGEPSRRRRFLECVSSGAELLFSVANAAELSGPQGKSADSVRAFLDEIGPRWLPAELSPLDVVRRELQNRHSDACLSESFLKSYTVHLMRDFTPASGRVINLGGDFFRLGAVLDWVGPQRESIREDSAKFDELMTAKLAEGARRFRQDPQRGEHFPLLPFHPKRPAQFACMNLLRTFMEQSTVFAKGDGMDFCHAVMASAYASFATLDKKWKARIETLPKPNGLARIYSPPQLSELVNDLEYWMKQPKPESN